MNLGDPELELIDPTPNVHSLFIHFDKMFFWTKLASTAVVRWSKRMYSCAGVCSYEGRGGVCDIALSEPLLKLRPRKDLIETLLHEMIHAFLFVTNRDQDRDGHGPNFKAHMHRINKCAGLNISIYHSFHDEVHLYQTHWWRCNGPCQQRRPHFGIVRRSMNRAPGPNDYWWNDHLRRCGGKFIKIKEPQKEQKSKAKRNTTTKQNADMTKYITNNIKTINNLPDSNNHMKPVLKDSTNVTDKTKMKTNSSSSVVVNKKVVITTPKTPSKPIPVFIGSGNTLNTGIISHAADVTETVRNMWANKQIATKEPVKKVNPSLKKPTFKEPGRGVAVSTPKHKSESTDFHSPPTKIRKIEDYFKATTILRDIYGDDYKLTQSNNSKKLVAVTVKVELVDCPICSSKFSNEEINRHLDECLNKDIIEKLSQDGVGSVQGTGTSDREPDILTTSKPKLKEVIGVIPSYKPKAELNPLSESNKNDGVDLTKRNVLNNIVVKNAAIPDEIQQCFPVPASKPMPSFTENNDNDLIDLTVFDFDDNFIINANKDRRKSESQVTLQSEPFIEESEKEISIVIEEQLVACRNKRRNTVSLITLDRGDGLRNETAKDEGKAGSSNEAFGQKCPCCGMKFDKPVQEHLDECLTFFEHKHTIPDEGASTSYGGNNASVFEEDEEDDKFDESQLFNETGTKTPCPCCMMMVEQDNMNAHLDMCLDT